MISSRLLIFFFVAVFSALSQTPNPANSSNAGKTDSISAEDQAAARHVWETILIKCGESYYESTGPNSVKQYQHPSFRVLSYKLSNADRANGYEWIGDAILITPLWRKLTRKDGKWVGEGWQDGTKEGFQTDIIHDLGSTQTGVVRIENVTRVVAMWKRNKSWQYHLHERIFNIYFFEIDKSGEPRGWYDELRSQHDQVDFSGRANARLACNSGNIELAEPPTPRARSDH